jgi:DNA-binding Lrp family transcriptional regulator
VFEEKKLPSAILLLSTATGTEKATLTLLKMMECVQEAYVVQSAYDIIVKVKAETFDKLSTTISKIKRFSHNPLGIITMVVIEGSSTY